MKAILVAIGNELVTGEVLETNSGYLARQLGDRGIEVVAHWTVGDDRGRIAAALAGAAEQADLVIASGGLGPTADDLTRQGLADALGAELVTDHDCLKHIEEFFCRRGRKMLPINRIQAMFPKGTKPIENADGTAPGIAAQLSGAKVFVLPGVPHEMRRMYQSQIASRLGTASGIIIQNILHTFGSGESDVAAKIGDLMKSTGDVSVGTTVAAGLVSIRISSRGKDRAQAEKRAKATALEVRSRLGKLLIGEGDEASMASAVGDLLRGRGQTVSTAESCTGGLMGQLITAVPGASEYYTGGFVCYSNQVKDQVLGVPADLLETSGAVSEPVAAAMACRCRQKMSSDWAIAVTGIAGPTGGTQDKPVGLIYVALAGPDGTDVHRHIFGGDRGTIRLRSALCGLNYLRLRLLG